MAIWLRFKAWIIAIGAAIVAILGVYFYGRKSGSMQEAQRQQEKDLETSRKVEDAADRARLIDGDVIDRLHKHGKLRDKP
jgi:hypothetical protein